MGVAERDCRQTQQRQRPPTFPYLPPPAFSAENSESQEIESIYEEDSTGRCVPDPEFSLAGLDSVERELKRHQPRRNNQRGNQETLVGVILGICAKNGQAEAELDEK